MLNLGIIITITIVLYCIVFSFIEDTASENAAFMVFL